MKTVELNNGVEMPILGFGTYQIEEFDRDGSQPYLSWWDELRVE